ncbi:unnamed protein product, partial [Chrysoparadoxa australica]
LCLEDLDDDFLRNGPLAEVFDWSTQQQQDGNISSAFAGYNAYNRRTRGEPWSGGSHDEDGLWADYLASKGPSIEAYAAAFDNHAKLLESKDFRLPYVTGDLLSTTSIGNQVITSASKFM